MTTDITKLAQSLKAAAEKAGADDWQTKKISGEFYVIRKGSYSSKCGYRAYQPIAEIDHKSTRDYVAIASPANILALVEALEKAQQYAKERDAENQDLMLTVGRLRVEREELESRTVKLPERYAWQLGYIVPDPNGDLLDLDDVIAALAAMGSEPVAWQYRVSAGPATGWSLWHDGKGEQYENSYKVERRPLYRHAQPAPVVPDDVLDALQKVARIRLDLNDFDGDRRGIADCLGDAEEALIEVVNRRAAMLQAGTLTNEDTKQAWTGIPDIDNAIIMLDRIDTQESCDDDRIEDVKTVLRRLAGSSPAIPDGWISCSELMPNDKQYVWCWGKSYGWTECNTFEGYYDWSRNKWWAVTDDGEEPASKVTHWMPLPEPPKEAK